MSKKLYDKYRGAMACVEIENTNGDLGIGSAFHVGEGVYITARHVIENNKIKSIIATEDCYVPSDSGTIFIHGDKQKYISQHSKKLTLKSGPFYHPNDIIDIAAFVVHEDNLVSIPLGGHLDDWISDSQFILQETLIMGYPPIPFSKEPLLVAAGAEINAIVDKYNAPHPHFIISSMPRGGFSGGVCLIEWGFVLGVITESLGSDYKAQELGFMSVVSVEPIFACLSHHNILPEIQKEGWDGFWDNNNNSLEDLKHEER